MTVLAYNEADARAAAIEKVQDNWLHHQDLTTDRVAQTVHEDGASATQC
jgi:hypothetical protein